MRRWYTRTVDWTDRQWRQGGNYRKLLLPDCAAIFLSLPFAPGAWFPCPPLFWAMVFSATAWTLFTLWRAWLYMKEGALQSGKQYEREGRYKLPPEYADSEDAFQAAERRRKARK